MKQKKTKKQVDIFLKNCILYTVFDLIMKQSNRILHESLGEKVYDHLLYQIITNQRPPKQKLSEVQLAKEFGVSRIPVREALSRLAKEKLIESIPRCGKHVKTFTTEEMREIYELRQVLEPLALRRVLARINPEIVKRAGNLLGKINRINGAGKYSILLKADEELHYIIRHYAGNKLLEEILQQLDYMARPLRALDARALSRMEALAGERKAILKAIIQRNVSRAEHLLRRHIKKGAESILAKLQKIQRSQLVLTPKGAKK